MNTFTVPSTVSAILPDYSELDYNLPTLKCVFAETGYSADADEVDATVAALNDEGKALFDDTLMTLCGWAHNTLCSMAAERERHWLDMFFDEMESDDENPFKETGRQISTWETTTTELRAAVDAVYQALYNLPLSAALTRIVDAIDANLTAQKG